MNSNRLTDNVKLLSLDSKQVQWEEPGPPTVRFLLKIDETDNHRVIFRLILERLLITE